MQDCKASCYSATPLTHRQDPRQDGVGLKAVREHNHVAAARRAVGVAAEVLQQRAHRHAYLDGDTEEGSCGREGMNASTRHAQYRI